MVGGGVCFGSLDLDVSMVGGGCGISLDLVWLGSFERDVGRWLKWKG